MNGRTFNAWSRIGLGTGRLASLGRGTTMGMVSDILAVMTELGVTVIDTADSYSSGECERLLGSAMLGKRDDYIIVTKAGYRHGDLPGPGRVLNPFIKKLHQKLSSGQCHEPAYLTRHLERSLQRLRTDRVDAFLLHDPPLAAVTDTEVQACLKRMQADGKTIHIGVSSGVPAVLDATIGAGCFSVIQTPADPGVVNHLADLWKSATTAGIQRMANHVFYSGDHPPTPRSGERQSHQKMMQHVVEHFGEGTILVGTRNPLHLRQAVKWASDS
jgi:aryl-alcohol dehydrogenase-like predicted oxidoreductase